MTLLTCASVRRRLQCYHDRELPVPDLIAVESHLGGCPPCARELKTLQALGDVLRLAAAPGPADDWTGVQPGVISRMRAEAHESWRARAQRFVEDVHLVWIGLASAAATVVLAGSILSLVHTMPGRDDSLAAVFAVLGAPSGSDLNPAPLDGRGLNLGPTRVEAPRVPQDGVVFASLENATMPEDVVVPLSVRVTKEGRVHSVEMLDRSGTMSEELQELVNEIKKGRLQPASYGPGHPTRGAPVAVNLVWLLARTTVKPGKT
ncbi:MAG TPA: zf-HC2 domain-containing protein [Vicinamibacterales bacterium]|nr:zf-HC2 domain-containing protein [Vicinamibacterales bacterium]